MFVGMDTTSKSIPLNQGKFALVDEGDFEWLNQWKWHFHYGYAERSVNLGRDITGKQHTKTIKMHQLIMCAPKGMEVDHKDGNKLDNRRSNLRICTHAENTQNRKVNYNKKFKGVNWHKRMGMWQVSIRVNKNLKHLGYFNDEIIAAKKYNELARSSFGEYARLNDV
jgi:hypothetical protein